MLSSPYIDCEQLGDRQGMLHRERPSLRRPSQNLSHRNMGYNFGMFGTSPYGPYWRHIRKISTLKVLSINRLEMLKHVRESEVKSAMKDTYDRWFELNSINSGENIEAEPLSCEMKNWFGEITFNVVFRMVVGKRFAETQDKETTQKALRDWFDLRGSFVISDALPYLRWLDLGGQERAMSKTAKIWINSFSFGWMSIDATGTLVQGKPSLSTVTSWTCLFPALMKVK